ncbi:hypothetical protein BT69DRAFT_1279167 [Atractiella rhizophila]|nr:hypothetical protein BT69DRAFT_1279167 [Atractiella rhizophila]
MASPTNDLDIPGPPHPYLQESVLYVHGLVNGITDSDLADALADCLKIRPEISRNPAASIYEPVSGKILFQEKAKAEKAYATVQGHSFPAYKCQMRLSISPNPGSDKPPASNVQPLLVKNLPESMSAGYLFQVFRPYGPIYKATLNYYDPYPGSGIPPKFNGEGVVQFYEISHARNGHGGAPLFRDWEHHDYGQRVFCNSPHCRSVRPFWRRILLVLCAVEWLEESCPSEMFRMSSPMPNYGPPSPTMTSSILSLQQQAQQRLEHESRGKIAPVIDPCNLFIKNLSPYITSQDLYTHFSPFGQIVSARVMKDEMSNMSREFGFVSFEKDFQAADALKAMDGKKLYSISQPDDPGRNIIVRLHEPKKSREPRLKQIHAQKERKKTGELSPTGSVMPTLEHNEGSTPGSPANITLSDAASADSPKANGMEASTSSADSSFQMVSPAPTTPATPAVPVEVPAVAVSPPVAAPVAAPSPTPTPIIPPTGTERERLHAAISQLEPAMADDITDMLVSLPKKEKAMCLFNPSFLKTKVAEAKMILDLAEEDEEPPAPVAPKVPTKEKETTSSLPTPVVTPVKEDPPKARAKSPAVLYSVKSLAALSSEQIWELIQTNSSSIPAGLLAKPNPSELAKAENLIESLPAKDSAKKQKVGDVIFKFLKAEIPNIKSVSKIVIKLLEKDDVAALCRLTFGYPVIVKEKALLVQQSL